MNLVEVLTGSAEQFPDRLAVKLDDRELNYGFLDFATQKIAGLLKSKGFEVGDRVGIMLPNIPHFPIIYYGILRAGGVVVPMNPLLKGREVKYYLEDSGAKIIFAWHGFKEEAASGAEQAGAEHIDVEPEEFLKVVGDAEQVEGVVDRDADDTAVILYTSGTTGQPKGAELTHSNMLSNAKASKGLFDVSEEDIVLGALPLFHSFGQTCGMNATMLSGGLLTMIPRFDPEKALEIMQRDKCTIFEGVPTMYTALLHVDGREKYDTSSLRVCASGGSALPGEILKSFEEGFKVDLLEGYGLSETSPVASFNQIDVGKKPGSIGTPIKGCEMKVVDDDGKEVEAGEPGEIVIRGENVMKGYWNKPEATEEAIKDGWFHSGDMAKVDDEGFFFIVDRKKELIIRGGYNVYPREIEEVIYEHPAVREAAVIGVPDDEWGEEIGAAIALKDGESVDADELREFVKKEVAAYKYPRLIWFVDELPKGPTGKILKREIEAPSDDQVEVES